LKLIHTPTNTFRIIVVQSKNAAEDDDTDQKGGTIKAMGSTPTSDSTGGASSLASETSEISQGVNLYILAGHENMQL
jgi:hypothetical protein